MQRKFKRQWISITIKKCKCNLELNLLLTFYPTISQRYLLPKDIEIVYCLFYVRKFLNQLILILSILYITVYHENGLLLMLYEVNIHKLEREIKYIDGARL